MCQNDEVRNDNPSAINRWSQRAETRPLNSVRIRVQDKCRRSSFIFDGATLRHNVIHLAIPCTIIVVLVINVESNQSLITSLQLLSFQSQCRSLVGQLSAFYKLKRNFSQSMNSFANNRIRCLCNSIILPTSDFWCQTNVDN